MKRRTFILATVAAGTAIAVPVLYNRYKAAKWDRPLIRPVMLSHFCDEDAIRQIGASYRSKFPAENTDRQLIDLLLPGNSGKVVSATDNAVDGSQLIEKIQQEFKSNQVLTINGWVISITEARQCALLSLT
jgi:hypothetical protein